ncbi:TKL protein kinase [Saprolegnia parasitica CBS 223.65]|uniref:TKL protein kinase n=1 Tax=Saprolegnia parasitica (strain CBS 223.65) TaxID=695850 RepID=A0A067C5T7_SAPPC|nr:TKL protein kinase [Saprolegnia parasitica CBS 223.65]KDO21916.1 TKL protein kinase [Saprolegnia parasitica CBS 223.65]|eukprot:XP_012207359.1 TKL protein kinase [Saprolegnia parasitica CBS 223.65]
MDGGNLTSYLEKIANDEPVPVVYAPIEMIWVVANALNDLHAKNVVHRDIKPDNILLSSKHYIKVGDVGIAKEESTNMTTGAGTSKWRAPEVLTSGSGYGTPADIYSFGVLLQTLYPNPLDASAEWAQALAAKCTAIDPTRRPTAAKLVDMLRPKLQSYVFDEQLHVAVEAGNVDDVRMLLASGVHPDSASDNTMTPLKTAVLLKHDSIADLLLAHAANVNVNNGSTALHVAAKRGSIAMLKKLLSVQDIDVDALSEIAHTPLHDAVLHGRMAHVVALADAGADLEAADHNTRRPLHMAVLLGHNDIVAFLLERGVCTSERNQYGDTVLHLAIQTGRGDIAALLIEAGADIHAVTVASCNPLHLACESGALDVVLALLARGADVNAKCNGHCPLFISILADHADVVAALMASPDIDFNQRYSGGVTLLHLAATKGSVDIVQTLLQAGVDFDVREKMSGQSAMDLATRQGNPEVIALIGAAHAHATKLLIAVVLRDEQRFAALLQHPFSCNFSDEVGCSLVHWAVLTRNETMLDLLLATPRVLLGTQNHEHKTPLALAIEFGCTSMAKKLFDRVQPRVVEIAATDYEVTTTQLGVGGFGVVLLGFYMDQKVAVKILKNAEHRKSFHAEAEALLACPSPYLVQLVAIAGRHSDTPALLFEYMDGGSLRTHLEKKRMNERTQVNVTNLHVAWVIANALRDLHAKELVHRDIKSDNVLLSSSGEVKLADLGLARLEATDMTEAPGTRFWMAPEILQAQGTMYGCPADIYAFGVLLTELNTCQVPYFDQDVQDRIAFTRGVINGTLRPTLTDDSEPWLRTLVEMCLRSDPAARPTADQVLETLRREVTAVAVPGMSTTEVFMRIAAIDDVDAAAHMLTSGLHVDGALPGGVSLLSAAIAAGAPNTVQLLVDRGASVNVQSVRTILLRALFAREPTARR